jgi:predicted RNA-binding Zn-ribbon protein involved in translation (DUF1610 family)
MAAASIAAIGVLVVWGCLGSWQLTWWLTTTRARVAGTSSVPELSMYAADRSATWAVGNMSTPPGTFPEILLASDAVLPDVAVHPAISHAGGWALLTVTLLATAFAGVVCGQWIAARIARRTYVTSLWRTPAVASAMSLARWRAVRLGVLCVLPCSAVAWYATFDRSAERTGPDELMTIGLDGIAALLAGVLGISSIIGYGAWWAALRNRATQTERQKARACSQCGYAVEGLRDTVCPECGTAIVSDEVSDKPRRGRLLKCVAACVLVPVMCGLLRDARTANWNATAIVRWCFLESIYVPMRANGFLLENVPVMIQSGDERVIVRWRRIDQGIQVCSERMERGTGTANGAAPVCTLQIQDAASGELQPPFAEIAIDDVTLRIRMSIFDGRGFTGATVPFEVSKQPDRFEQLTRGRWPAEQ